MSPVTLVSRQPEETMKCGALLARHFQGGEIVCLSGDLGTGKTTLVKGIARALKINPLKVNSPTFVLMNAYQGRLPLFHFDLYRLDSEKEILRLDYEEYFFGEGVAVVEWAEKLGRLRPKECLQIELTHENDNRRLIKISSLSKRYDDILLSFVPPKAKHSWKTKRNTGHHMILVKKKSVKRIS
jgi:tRNA threonylcarbamoyladenosine biosynthesis protein TsaE